MDSYFQPFGDFSDSYYSGIDQQDMRSSIAYSQNYQPESQYYQYQPHYHQSIPQFYQPYQQDRYNSFSGAYDFDSDFRLEQTLHNPQPQYNNFEWTNHQNYGYGNEQQQINQQFPTVQSPSFQSYCEQVSFPSHQDDSIQGMKKLIQQLAMKRMQMANGLYSQQEIEASEQEIQIQLDQLRSSIQQMPHILPMPRCLVPSHASVLERMDCRVEDTLVSTSTALQDSSTGVHCDFVLSDAPDMYVIEDVVGAENNVYACGTLDQNVVISDVIVDSSACVFVDIVTTEPDIEDDVVLSGLSEDVSAQTCQPDQKTSVTMMASNCEEQISLGMVDSWPSPDWTFPPDSESPTISLMTALTANAIIQPPGWKLLMNRLRPPEMTSDEAIILEGAA